MLSAQVAVDKYGEMYGWDFIYILLSNLKWQT